MNNRKPITIREYDYLAVGNDSEDVTFENNRVKFIKKEEFEIIHNFVLESNTKKDSEVFNFLMPSYHRKFGRILTAQNYVGVIQTKTGLTVEILPKISKIDTDEESRKIVLKMLRTLRDSPFKKFDISNLKTTKMHLLEVFIEMFLVELWEILRKGVRRHYVEVEENLKYLKGKLLISRHLKENLCHRERFYVTYDDFLPDITENRLIKSTLKYLLNISISFINQKRIREYLFILDEVEYSKNIEHDFLKIKNNRLIKDYETVLKWCRVFLKKESFTNFSGNENAFALLFPMEKVFESYITYHLSQMNFALFSPQHNKYKLVTENNDKRFAIRPDIYACNHNHELLLIDAKWKILNLQDSQSNYGISQSDLYQMFSYAKIYDSTNQGYKSILFLVYPKPFGEKIRTINYRYSDDQTDLHILFYDLKEEELIGNEYISTCPIN